MCGTVEVGMLVCRCYVMLNGGVVQQVEQRSHDPQIGARVPVPLFSLSFLLSRMYGKKV